MVNIQIKQIKEKIHNCEWLFFISYAIFISYMILYASFFQRYIYTIWKPVYIVLFFILFLYEITRNGQSLRYILIFVVIALLFININMIARGVYQNCIGALLLYMYCARNLSFHKIAKVTVIISSFVLAIVVLSAYSGIILNYVTDSARRREYMGFRYSLFGPSILSNITVLWIYLKKQKMSVIGAVIFGFINYYFFVKTNARLCFYLTILMLIAGLLLKKISRFVLRRKILNWGMVLSFLIAAAVSFALTIKYNPSISWMQKLNRLLEDRLLLGQKSLTTIGYKLFGIEGIEWVGNGLDMYGNKTQNDYLYVDNYYIQITQRFGLVFFILAILLLTYAAYRSYKTKDIYMLTIFCMLAVHFMIDDLYMFPQYNTFWFAAAGLVFPPFQKKFQMLSEFRKRQKDV